MADGEQDVTWNKLVLYILLALVLIIMIVLFLKVRKSLL